MPELQAVELRKVKSLASTTQIQSSISLINLANPPCLVMEDSKLQCQRVSSSEPNDKVLRELQALSVKVFAPYFPDTKQDHPSFDFSAWQDRIKLRHAVVDYATTSSSSQPLGFFFAVPRTQAEIGLELLHIWIVAVDPESRGLGVFPLLLERMKQYARSCGYPELTICTRPKQFHRMYRILGEHGWQEVAWRQMEDGEWQQVLMRLSI